MKKRDFRRFILLSLIVLIFIIVLVMLRQVISDSFGSREVIELEDENSLLSDTFSIKIKPELMEGDLRSSKSQKTGLDIFIFEDYGDPFSAEYALELEKLESEFAKKINLIFRPFSRQRDALSFDLALAIECLNEQKKANELRLEIFKLHRASEFSIERLNEFIANLKIKQDQYNSCLTSPDKRVSLEELIEDASKYSITGSPSTIINTELVIGARPYESFTNNEGERLEGLRDIVQRHLESDRD